MDCSFFQFKVLSGSYPSAVSESSFLAPVLMPLHNWILLFLLVTLSSHPRLSMPMPSTRHFIMLHIPYKSVCLNCPISVPFLISFCSSSITLPEYNPFNDFKKCVPLDIPIPTGSSCSSFKVDFALSLPLLIVPYQPFSYIALYYHPIPLRPIFLV